MKGMRPGRLLLALGTLAVVAAASSPGPATADTAVTVPTLPKFDAGQGSTCGNNCGGVSSGSGQSPCNPGRPNDGVNGLVGWTASSNNAGAGGVYAKILNYTPYVAYPDVTAWVMLTTPGTPDVHAQVGWLQYPGNDRRTFVEWTDASGNPTLWDNYAAEPVGSLPYYTVLYNNTPNEFTFYLDGNEFASAPAYWFPTVAAIAGENQTSANQMPGNFSSPEDFSDAHVWLDNTWFGFNGVLSNSNPNYYNASVYSTTHMQIGDKACTG